MLGKGQVKVHVTHAKKGQLTKSGRFQRALGLIW